MASSWTDEQIRKLVAACEEAFDSGSCSIGSDEYWEYIVNRVGDGKTVKDCKKECERTTKATYEGGLSSTWTKEEIRKCKVAFKTAFKNSNSLDLDSTEFWDYIAKEVGGRKTGKDCKELHMKGTTQSRTDNTPKNEK